MSLYEFRLERKISNENHLTSLILQTTEPIFFDRLWGETKLWNWVGAENGIESAMSNKMKIFKAETAFLNFKEPITRNRFTSNGFRQTRNRFLGSLKGLQIQALTGPYDNPIPTLFLAPIDVLNFLYGIDFSFPADSCHIICVLKMCWPIGASFPHTQHMTITILKSSIPSHGIDVSKNQFHNVNDFSQRIESV